jgi:hypothetical protein
MMLSTTVGREAGLHMRGFGEKVFVVACES